MQPSIPSSSVGEGDNNTTSSSPETRVTPPPQPQVASSHTPPLPASSPAPDRERQERKSEGNTVLSDRIASLCFDAREFGISEEEWRQLCTPEGEKIDLVTTTPDLASTQNVSFSASHFVQAKLRYGASLEMLHEDLDVFATLLKEEIHQHLETHMKPNMATVAQRGASLGKEIESIRPPLHQTVQQLQDLCEKLRLAVMSVREKVDAGESAAVRQSFGTAYLKAMLLYEQMSVITMGETYSQEESHHPPASPQQDGDNREVLHDKDNDDDYERESGGMMTMMEMERMEMERSSDSFSALMKENAGDGETSEVRGHENHHNRKTGDGIEDGGVLLSSSYHGTLFSGRAAVRPLSYHARQKRQRRELRAAAAALFVDENEEEDEEEDEEEEQDNVEDNEGSGDGEQASRGHADISKTTGHTRGSESSNHERAPAAVVSSSALLRATREGMESMPLLISGVLELRRLRELLRCVRASHGVTELDTVVPGAGHEWNEVCGWCEEAESFVLQHLEKTFLQWCEHHFEACGLAGARHTKDTPTFTVASGESGHSSAAVGLERVIPAPSTSSSALPSTRMLQEIPHWFHVLGATARFTDICQQKVLIPLLQRVVSWTAAAQSRHNVEAMLELLKRLETVIQQHVAPLLPLWSSPHKVEGGDGGGGRRRTPEGETAGAERTTTNTTETTTLSSPGAAVYPVSDIVWPSVCTVLQEKLASLFDAGIPEAFRRKYLAAWGLEQVVADLCTTPEEAARLRRSATSRTWRGKWNVDIYAAECVMTSTKAVNQLTENWKRAMMLVIGIGAPSAAGAPHYHSSTTTTTATTTSHQDVRAGGTPHRPASNSVRSSDSTAAGGGSPPPSQAKEGHVVSAPRVLAFDALQGLWSALRRDVFERFFTEMYLPSATPTLLRHGLLSSKSSAARVSQVLGDVFRSMATFTASGTYAEMELGVLTLALAGMEDIALLAEYITSSGLQLVVRALENAPAGLLLPLDSVRGTTTGAGATGGGANLPASSTIELVRAVVEQACQFTSERLRKEEYAAIRALVVDHVDRHVSPPLQHIKSVRSLFSHTQRELPDTPSWYVSTIVDPIRALGRAFHLHQQQQQQQEQQEQSKSPSLTGTGSTRSKVAVWGVDFAGSASPPSSPPQYSRSRLVQVSLAEDYRAMMLHITRAMLIRFGQLAKETLSAAKKAEEGWEKLRRKREAAAAATVKSGGGGGGSAGVLPSGSDTTADSRRRVACENATDIDKMFLQLYLDANELMKQLGAILPAGVMEDLEKDQAVTSLHTLLRRGAWISGAAVEEPTELDW